MAAHNTRNMFDKDIPNPPTYRPGTGYQHHRPDLPGISWYRLLLADMSLLHQEQSPCRPDQLHSPVWRYRTLKKGFMILAWYTCHTCILAGIRGGAVLGIRAGSAGGG